MCRSVRFAVEVEGRVGDAEAWDGGLPSLGFGLVIGHTQKPGKQLFDGSTHAWARKHRMKEEYHNALKENPQKPKNQL